MEPNSMFIEAVIHWLAEFPGSPIKVLSTIAEFIAPQNLYKLFEFLMNPEDLGNGEFSTYFDRPFTVGYGKEEDMELHVPCGLIIQAKALELGLEFHTSSYFSKVGYLDNFWPEVSNLNWLRLVLLNDTQQIYNLCQVLVKVGTISSKKSTVGLVLFGFLSATDQEQIERYLNANSVDRVHDPRPQEVADQSKSQVKCTSVQEPEPQKDLEAEQSQRIGNVADHQEPEPQEDFHADEGQSQVKTNSFSKHHTYEEHLTAMLWEKEIMEGLVFNLIG
ncbi:uncharacterized protein CANTADRAFT_11492 [Suhomyces tanzawaensis NRRL Y-17324]|uniref:Uncharacterized protein n=1 Tax=Suhomyces tanzawaensis NRRL Y-17324 TaxID=984487 RepID=A0A1E4SI64_9ASCO|nr:uncharacterized protein CANTADRAFT_11492 [Suhomyces tanzawaensis NRRL Y-17324]ODV79193.1 hypothetical protein CANTADRAFT_11492 [Suhomyces tanzawaensis NRRL Y-17324]